MDSSDLFLRTQCITDIVNNFWNKNSKMKILYLFKRNNLVL